MSARSLSSATRVAVVGAGWAGIAAAVHAHRLGHRVTVFEMARQLGGRARTVRAAGHALDNGQHILIGAYHETLELMRCLDVDPAAVLYRTPLRLEYADGYALQLPPGAPLPAFVRGVLGCRGWRRRERVALLWAALGWALRGFSCDDRISVAELCARLPEAVRQRLIDPLCVAALNTPANQASAKVFLRVLHDALFGGPGSADLLLPRGSLDALLPGPAAAWFERQGVGVRLGERVMSIESTGARWWVDGEAFDHLILACTAAEATRLSAAIAPQWAQTASQLRYEPIVTVYLRCAGARLPVPMTALLAGPVAPAQFAFDLGALGGAPGIFAFVISGARQALEQGLDSAAETTRAQARAALPRGTWPAPPEVLHAAVERRATFACTPGLRRPPARIAPGLLAAGDYVAGPYPATLEGAVRSGRHAAQALRGMPPG